MYANRSVSPKKAMDAYVDVFWDPEMKYFFARSDHKQTFGGLAPLNGTYTGFWGEARLWELVMDAYETTEDEKYRPMIDDVYDGFRKQFPQFGSEYNDDVMWWAQASTRAYRITKNERYLETAKELYHRILEFEDDELGGGIWWRRNVHDAKNVCINAPAALVAGRLYTLTNDPQYLEDAKRLFTYVDEKLHEDGHVFDHIRAEDGVLVKWDFTYNFGTYISAALWLYDIEKDQVYFDKAVAAADWAVANLTSGGILRHEGSGDGGGFKTHLVRALHDLVTQYDQEQYRQFLIDNGAQAWANRRTSDDIMGSDWSGPPQKDWIESLASSAAVTAVLLAPGKIPVVKSTQTDTFEAENADAFDIEFTSEPEGYTGRGYLANWDNPELKTAFQVNVRSGGCYQLNFRYATPAGDAKRTLSISGEDATTVDFPATNDWSNVTVEKKLSSGHNAVELTLENASEGKLNLDNLTIARC